MKKIINLLVCLLFVSCTNGINGVNTDLSTYNFSTVEELNKYIQNNINNLDFQNDPYGDLLYCNLGKYKIKFDPYNAEIIKNKILLPYSYTFDGVWGSSYAIYELTENRKGGVLLSFDDYFYENWDNILEVFDEYNIKATFFCMGDITRTGLKKFIYKVQSYGLEAGYHTLNHKVLTNCTEEELYQQVIDPINTFRKYGIEFSSFSFPGGGIPKDEKLFNMVKETFKIVRSSGLGRVNLYYTREEIEDGFIYGSSFDQLFFETDDSFRNMIKMRLIIAKLTDKIWPGFGHYFLSENEEKDDLDYTIKVSNLKYMLELINELELTSYLYKDFY